MILGFQKRFPDDFSYDVLTWRDITLSHYHPFNAINVLAEVASPGKDHRIRDGEMKRQTRPPPFRSLCLVLEDGTKRSGNFFIFVFEFVINFFLIVVKHKT